MSRERTVTKQTPEGDRVFRITLWDEGSGITIWRADAAQEPEIVCLIGQSHSFAKDGVTPDQLSAWESLCNADWPEFRATVNASPHVRIRL